jgi:hypothetical protein
MNEAPSCDNFSVAPFSELMENLSRDSQRGALFMEGDSLTNYRVEREWWASILRPAHGAVWQEFQCLLDGPVREAVTKQFSEEE